MGLSFIHGAPNDKIYLFRISELFSNVQVYHILNPFVHWRTSGLLSRFSYYEKWPNKHNKMISHFFNL